MVLGKPPGNAAKAAQAVVPELELARLIDQIEAEAAIMSQLAAQARKLLPKKG